MRQFLLVLACVTVNVTFAADEKPAKPAKPVAPEVVGAWQGVWGPVEKISGKDVPPMKFECQVVRKGELWEATFEGECGRPYKYTIKMDGRQAGAVVLFKGTVDLGEKDGGVYDWIGRADDKEFVGFYTSAKYTGTFRLGRPKPAPKPPEKTGAKDPQQAELRKLAGTWTTTTLTYNGKDFLADGKGRFNFVFKGDVATIEGNDEIKKEYAKIRVKLNPATMPPLLDMTVLGGIQMDAVIEGIYELKDNELKICAKVLGNERPTEFSSPGGSSIALLVLMRQK